MSGFRQFLKNLSPKNVLDKVNMMIGIETKPEVSSEFIDLDSTTIPPPPPPVEWKMGLPCQNRDQFVRTVMETRKALDSIYRTVDDVRSKRSYIYEYGVSDMLEAARAIKLAKMWCGKILEGGISHTHPYPNSDNASNIIIEPQADVGESWLTNMPNKRKGPLSEDLYVKLIKELRFTIPMINELNMVIIFNWEEFDGIDHLASHKAYEYLCEAKMWLGQELNNVFEFRQRMEKLKQTPTEDSESNN